MSNQQICYMHIRIGARICKLRKVKEVWYSEQRSYQRVFKKANLSVHVVLQAQHSIAHSNAIARKGK